MPRPSTCWRRSRNSRGVRPDPEAFIEALDPLQPRLYSISSSPKAHPGRISLTVDAVRYEIGKRQRARRRLDLPRRARRARRHAARPMCRRRTISACPPIPPCPIIMVGPGTGIAPFRAFLHERMATKAPGRNWLFFGHQRRDYDFFYEDELAGMRAAGVLTRLVARLVARRHREVLRAGPHARGRPRPVGLARRRRPCLCLRRRAHGPRTSSAPWSTSSPRTARARTDRPSPSSATSRRAGATRRRLLSGIPGPSCDSIIVAPDALMIAAHFGISARYRR